MIALLAAPRMDGLRGEGGRPAGGCRYRMPVSVAAAGQSGAVGLTVDRVIPLKQVNLICAQNAKGH